MATQRPRFAVSYPELAAALLSSSEVLPRAHLVAQQLAGLFGDCAVVVYLFDENVGWEPKATEGEVAFLEPVIAPDFGTLGAMLAKQGPVVFTGPNLRREDYAHLNVRRTLASLAAIPMFVDENLIGGVEVLSFQQPIAEASLGDLAEFGKLAALGLSAGAAYESERNSQLESITRITQMYDLEKVFNSNLELEDLMNMITAKFREVMNVQAVNLWMVEGDAVVLTSQAGTDPTAEVGGRQRPGEGAAGDISDGGEPVLIEDPADERLALRNQDIEEGAIFSLVAAPVMDRGALVGVVEAINRMDGVPFDEDEQFLLTTMCETASNALHNASLLQAERKVEILQTLVTVSQEITSTLNLERVLQTIVHGPQAVIPYERAAIMMDQAGKLRLSAVSGMSQINRSDPDVKRLDELLLWAYSAPDSFLVTQHDDEIDADREESRAKFQRYFQETGMRAFYALPLADDQGRLGLLSFESSDPDFLNQTHMEMIKVLAGQATVALRNAEMYTQVPFIGIIEPLLQKKQRFMRMEAHRRKMVLVLAAAILAFLVVVPLPMRVDGSAAVEPVHSARVQPDIDGVVNTVNVREGDQVTKGTILGTLEDWEARSALAAAEAKRNTAVSEMNRALAANHASEAGIQKVEADYWSAQVSRARERLEHNRLRSPIDGVIATPHIENLVGAHLEAGSTFAEVVDTSRATVDVAVEEKDVGLLQPGSKAAVKLESFPTHTFRGEVQVVSPKNSLEGEQRVFFARVKVANPDGLIRAGMQGRGKVSVGWRPAGYVLFRGLAMWAWAKLWYWFGW